MLRCFDPQEDSAPYQDVLEARYQECVQGDAGDTYYFERDTFFYQLNFTLMQQRNVESNTVRAVRRRPLYSVEYV